MKRILIFLLVLLLLLPGCQKPGTESASVSESRSQPASSASSAPESEPEPNFVPEPEPLPKPEDPLRTLLASMTVEEKVGQLFLARFPYGDPVEELGEFPLGGYILFAKDFKERTPEQAAAEIARCQAASAIPLLMAVDEEGGIVNRVSCCHQYRAEPFPSPRSLYRDGGLSGLLTAEEEKCLLLRSLGLNVNMAPVCDVTTDPNAFLYPRSLGLSPQETGRAIAAVVRVMERQQVGSVLKHFPGYGNNADTHVGIAVDHRPLEELEQKDLVPFAKGIRAGCGGILVSHTIVTAMDPELPASLSPAVHRYLREEMGFEGVIVTDDLVMQAITQQYGAEEAAVLAVLSGNDLLCSSEYLLQYPAVLGAVQDGRISMEQLDQAVLRVLRWKAELGLLEAEKP